MSIERQAMSALKWATISKAVVQTVSWAGTLIVVRLLTPDDYGLMAKVVAVCSIAAAIAELGLGTAIVRSGETKRDDLRKIFGVSLLVSLAITAALIAGTPLFARLFHEPRVIWPIAAASLQILISAVAIIPASLATRDLSFRHLAKIEMASGLANIATTAPLAYLGAGVWSLVVGTLVATFVRSGLLLAFGERMSPRFSLDGIAEDLKFGLTLAGSRVSYFILVQSDVLIGAMFLSTIEIGQYSVALQLATLPMLKVMGTINQITVPVIARQQRDRERVREILLKSLRLMSLVAMPALWGISAVAPELVRTLFGTKWLAATAPLAILPLVVPLRMVCGIIFTTSLALGYRTLELRNTIVNFVLLPTGFYVGAHWGVVGLSVAWLITVPLAYAFNLPAVLRAIGVSASEVIRETMPPVIAAALMYAAVAAVRLAIGSQMPPAIALATLSTAGAVVYVGVLAIISRRHLLSIRNFARSMVQSGGEEAVLTAA
jgi:teichuronic acid exporter